MLFCMCRYHTECVEAVCTQTNQELHQIQCWNPYCDEDARKPTPEGLVSAGPPGDSQELFIGKVKSVETVRDDGTAHDEITAFEDASENEKDAGNCKGAGSSGGNSSGSGGQHCIRTTKAQEDDGE